MNHQRLVLPLLAALALHGLWLATGQLRRPAGVPAPAARMAASTDDTPELLRLSRRLSLQGSLRVATPLPPAPAPPAPTAPKLPPAAPTTATPARRAATARPAPRRPISRTPQASRGAAARPAPPAATTTTTPREAARLSRLWAQAAPPDEAPAPLAGLPAAAQLRRLPLAEARALGLAEPPEQPQRLQSDLLLLWPEEAELWLLRLPLGPATEG